MRRFQSVVVLERQSFGAFGIIQHGAFSNSFRQQLFLCLFMLKLNRLGRTVAKCLILCHSQQEISTESAFP